MGTSHLIDGFDQYSFILFITSTEYKTNNIELTVLKRFVVIIVELYN